MTSEYITRAQLLLQYYDALEQLAAEDRAAQVAAERLPKAIPAQQAASQASL